MGALYSKKPVIYGLNINTFVFDEKRVDTMPPERAQKIRSFRFADDRKRSLAAGLLLEAALGREALFGIRRRGGGRPYLDGGPYFSISHSGDWAALAVCEENAGFDIELVRADRDTALIARHAFQPEEIEAVGRDVKMFYRVWTARESYLKMVGGPPVKMTDFCVQLADGAGRIKGGGGESVRFFEQFDGYAAAVCSPAGLDWPREITALTGI
ncbi:MAG: 4'-phosphopantetheinyl transferase superfamily protein [Spirochaetaceae bacterium]|jgi:4'-phosphopantetheinyl transferase|nr:4'-phosphopantetheinyl transferase superfamily protein [Spirochaetaceae bacterium]